MIEICILRQAPAKTLMFAFQMFVYNAWQIQRAYHRRLRHVPTRWRKDPTLERFCDRLKDQKWMCAQVS